MTYTNPIAPSPISSLSLPRDPFIQNIYEKVMQTINNADQVPGYNSTIYNTLKTGLSEKWGKLVETGLLEERGTDADIRPYFVSLQGIIEHVLASELKKSVSSLTGVIHTPAPATPLCTIGEVSAELVDKAVVEDPLRLFTVKARSTILRDYLFQGGELYVVYPSKGLEVRNGEQKKIYATELEKYPTRLFNRPLTCDAIANDKVGAFYLFKNNEGKLFAFAIKMTQANATQPQGDFALWFGEYNNSAIKERITEIEKDVLKYSSQPIPLSI